MGELYEIKLKIEQVIAAKGLDPIRTKGEIGLKAGLMLGFITPQTPDNDFKLKRLKQAAKDILNEVI